MNIITEIDYTKHEPSPHDSNNKHNQIENKRELGRKNSIEFWRLIRFDFLCIYIYICNVSNVLNKP